MSNAKPAQPWDPEKHRLYLEAMAVCAGRKDATPVEVAKLVDGLNAATATARYLQGGLLKKLRDGEKWRVLMPEASFDEFTKDRFGFGGRTGRYLVAVHEKAMKLGLTIDKLMKVGWTKLIDVLKVATPEDVNEWLERAETTPRSQLQREVREHQGGGGGEGGGGERAEKTTRKWSVELDLDRYEFAEAMLEQAQALVPQKVGQMPSRAAALDLILVAWGGMHLDKERALRWHVQNLERAYDVELMVKTKPDKAA